MSFHFSLDTLLRLRKIAEEREERLFTQILNQIVQSRQTLSDLASQRHKVLLEREQAIEKRTSALEINGYYARLDKIAELERTGLEHLTKLVELRDQQATVYEAAHRQTELLAGMRAEHKERFKHDLAKQEQNAMDDNFASRRAFR